MSSSQCEDSFVVLSCCTGWARKRTGAFKLQNQGAQACSMFGVHPCCLWMLEDVGKWLDTKSWLCCQDDAAHQYISLLTASKLEATFWMHNQESFSCDNFDSHHHKLENWNACSLLLHRLSSQQNRCMQAPKPRCTNLQNVWECLCASVLVHGTGENGRWRLPHSSCRCMALHSCALWGSCCCLLMSMGWAFVAHKFEPQVDRPDVLLSCRKWVTRAFWSRSDEPPCLTVILLIFFWWMLSIKSWDA